MDGAKVPLVTAELTMLPNTYVKVAGPEAEQTMALLGELVETEDAYYVRKPDQDNRQVFKLTKQLCEHDVTPDEVKELLSEGRSQLIENFVSKRGNKFAAYLMLSAKKDKAEFEFPPR